MLPTIEKKWVVQKIQKNEHLVTILGKRNLKKVQTFLGKPYSYYYKSLKYYPDRCEMWSFIVSDMQLSEVKKQVG